MSVDTPAWVRDAVFYQIFPDRFARSERVIAPGPLEPWDVPPTIHGFKGGNLPGITEHLDELAELGINALYLTPIFQSASNHRYHAYDYLQVDPLLGGNAALRGLIDACHARGMRIVLDGVFNHTGRGFWAFHHVLEAGAASPYRDWFVFDQERLDAGRPVVAYPSPEEQRVLDEGGSIDDHRRGGVSARVLGYRAWWDMPALPKLNVANPRVREYLLGVAEHWIRFGIDGWRLDVPQEIDDPPFWRAFRERVRAANPEAYIVGEIWQVAPNWLTGDRFDAVMNYPLLEAVLGYTAARHLDRSVIDVQFELARTVRPLDAPAFGARLRELLAVYDPAVTAVQLNLLDSHDTPRFLTMAGGDRDALRLAQLLVMTLPGAPCIYYGDEIGLAGRHDPDSRRAFPWDPARWDQALRAHTRSLIALRRAHPALRGEGSFRTAFATGDVHVHVRATPAEALVVAVNAGTDAVDVSVEVPEAAGRRVRVVWSGGDDPAAGGEPGARFERAGDADRTRPGGGASLAFRVPGRGGLVLLAEG